jgi:hypothetical protein
MFVSLKKHKRIVGYLSNREELLQEQVKLLKNTILDMEEDYIKLQNELIIKEQLSDSLKSLDNWIESRERLEDV